MATQSANVYIKNNSGSNARIFLFHSNDSTSPSLQSDNWTAKVGDNVGPLTVYFKSYWEDGYDLWSVLIHIQDGPAPGFYVCSGAMDSPYWNQCQLQDGDAGQDLTFSVSATGFDVTLSSGANSFQMTKLSPSSMITHVFVVMLENHSFDNMFAMSKIPKIKAATTSDSNTYTRNSKSYTCHVHQPAPTSMPTDPGHEFLDVVEQLCGPGAQCNWDPAAPFPPVKNSGFAQNYATTTDEDTGIPTLEDVPQIMACFDTQKGLPRHYQLATEFALCDHWYSSMLGVTWANRFFVHGASSCGLDSQPSKEMMAQWETPYFGFAYPNGSIYDKLDDAGIPYRFYNDYDAQWLSLYSDDPANGSKIGAVPQLSSLAGVSLVDDFFSLQQFESDLQEGPYPYPYTFIEPHYGDVVDETYAGGSSEHPMDDVLGGENLLASVYSAIRNSPYWDTSLLIVIYDEHGGFYDCVAPPSAPPPGDNPNPDYGKYNFKFNQYGVRVPAIIVSPLIEVGTVDDTTYDHSSVLKTVEKLFGLPHLTDRDCKANHFLHLLSLGTPRTDCPTSLSSAAPRLSKAAKPRMTAQERARRDAQPMPQSGNLVGALQNLLKAEIEIELGAQTSPKSSNAKEMAAVTEIYKEKLRAIQTRGQAREYAATVMEKVRIAREEPKRASSRKPKGPSRR